VKILFAMSSPEYLRFYDAAVIELARRGHDVAIAVSTVRDGKPVRLQAIGDLHASVSMAGLVPGRDDRWTEVARALRGTMDFVRYLHPALASARLLRARVRYQALPWSLGALDRIASLEPRWVSAAMNGLAAIERAIPTAASLRRFLDTHDPDLVLVSPLVEPASDQVDLVRAARERGTRVATLVASWDNLTNKGDLRVATDLVVVWNDTQKREAVELHRVRPDQVVVTGAPVFDRWFGRAPSVTREEFCQRVGLPAHKRMVLFTGSSIFIARADVEMAFVRRWIDALRASHDPFVSDLAVLVRPHPYNGTAWNPEAFADLPGVAVWPRGGYDPIDERSRAGFFDSMHYAEAVVGINTSAMIEAAIVGRPVFSIEAPEFAGTQEGTLHYRCLLPENGGFLRVASTLAQHVDQLATVLADPQASRAQLRGFVSRFVRPCGLERPALPILVDAIERYGTSPAPRPAPPSVLARFGHVVLLPAPWLAPLLRSEAARRHRMGTWIRRSWHLIRRGGRLAIKDTRAAHQRYVRWPARRLVRSSARVWRRGRAVAAPVRRARRALRLARYHAGTFARRLRGAPTE
jgi:hypothetical protein